VSGFEVVALIVVAIAAATALCWVAVAVAVRRVRQDRMRPGGRTRPDGI
jgi:hypothetical protein